MAKDTLVDKDVKFGAKLVKELMASKFPVQAAAWHTEPDGREAQLFIVTPFVRDPGPKTSYALLQSILAKWRPSERVAVDKIHLIQPQDFFARHIKNIAQIGEISRGQNKYEGVDGAFVEGDFVYLFEFKAS